WPRIQGAMLDENSLVVTYQAWRGEPRSRHQKTAESDQQFGDCIDCNQCVAVCPMGIDIRDGEQLECITCALCIDACNDVMDKIGRPRDLISYTTYNAYAEASAGQPVHKLTWRTIIRPRTLVYTGVWILAGLLMLLMLVSRDRLDVNVIRDRNPVFVQLSNGDIRNGYTVKILNMEAQPRTFRLSTEGLAGATMAEANQGNQSARHIDIAVEADKLRSVRVLVSTARNNLDGAQTPFKFIVVEQTLSTDPAGDGERVEYDTVFRGPDGQD
ncbi:MAG: 4Fe-4S dicluster domain-containing protein, partial [Fimbriimonadaceae bacterium]|nr:4Fe-4S dicluster domain-containing protein [Alphaproteobacteria bacterium]